MNITINVPDQIGVKINLIPDRDRLTVQALKKMLEEYRFVQKDIKNRRNHVFQKLLDIKPKKLDQRIN